MVSHLALTLVKVLLNVLVLVLYRNGDKGYFMGVSYNKKPVLEVLAKVIFIGFLIYNFVELIARFSDFKSVNESVKEGVTESSTSTTFFDNKFQNQSTGNQGTVNNSQTDSRLFQKETNYFGAILWGIIGDVVLYFRYCCSTTENHSTKRKRIAMGCLCLINAIVYFVDAFI